MHVFRLDQVSAGYGNKRIIHTTNLTLQSNKISVLIGANGCGKSTLLKTMARLIRPSAGEITLDGRNIARIPPKTLAKTLGLLPQSPLAPEGISVADLVGRGRFPHQRLLGGWTEQDYTAVAEAMELMGVQDLANRPMDELSGGQRQRVWIAMALAQQTDILFLDEPTSFLDITYQIEILDRLAQLNRTRGTTMVMVLHDINLSARYGDYLYALHRGTIACEGAPAQIITAELIKTIFALDCLIIGDPVSHTPLVIPRTCPPAVGGATCRGGV
jgi:iron complex transport system ATP-binding protein